MGRSTRKPENGLGAKMRAARVARGLGLRDLAALVGMSPSSLSEFENGKSTPGPVRLQAISEALEVPLAEPPNEAEVPSFEHWRRFEPMALDPVRAAALDLFVELGYHGSTVRMIADRCGMTVAGVYHHVSSKEELLTGLLERTMNELLARLVAADAEAATPQQRLSNLVECLVLFHIHRLPWGFVASSELRSLDDDHRKWLLDARSEVRRMLQDASASYRGLESTAVSEQTTARAIGTMCVGVMDWWVAAGKPDPDVVAAEFATLAIAMVQALPAGPSTD